MTGHDALEEKSFFTEINICELVCHQKKVCMSNYNAPRRKKIKQRDIKHLFSIHSGVRELAYVIPHFIHSYFDCNDNTSKRRNIRKFDIYKELLYYSFKNSYIEYKYNPNMGSN